MSMEVGEILKKLREIKDYTMEELAEKADLDRSTIHRYETMKTKVSNDVMTKVAQALGISVPDIYAIKEKPSVLEDPFTFYKGKSQSSVQVLVTLDGSLSTLNSWFATLKKLNAALN